MHLIYKHLCLADWRTGQKNEKIGLKIPKCLTPLLDFYPVWLKLFVEPLKGKTRYMHIIYEDFEFAKWPNHPILVLKWPKMENLEKNFHESNT